MKAERPMRESVSMMPRFASLRPTVFALTLAAGLTAAAVYAQDEPRLDVIYVPTPRKWSTACSRSPTSSPAIT